MHRLIILILLFSWVSHPVSLDAGPIDYFDITRPKFKPLPVVIRMNPANHLQGLYVQSVFQSNLEQTLFFRVYEENSLPESLIKGNEPPAFTMNLQILEENPGAAPGPEPSPEPWEPTGSWATGTHCFWKVRAP